MWNINNAEPQISCSACDNLDQGYCSRSVTD